MGEIEWSKNKPIDALLETPFCIAYTNLSSGPRTNIQASDNLVIIIVYTATVWTASASTTKEGRRTHYRILHYTTYEQTTGRDSTSKGLTI